MTETERQILVNQMSIIELLTYLVRPGSNPPGADHDAVAHGLQLIKATARLLGYLSNG